MKDKRKTPKNKDLFAENLPVWELTCIFAHEKECNDMVIINAALIDEFCRKHADAKSALEKWVEFVEKAEWHNHAELKNDYLSADYVGNSRYVFNIKGNKYRLVLLVVFLRGKAVVRFIGTHQEYDKIKNIQNV